MPNSLPRHCSQTRHFWGKFQHSGAPKSTPSHQGPPARCCQARASLPHVLLQKPTQGLAPEHHQHNPKQDQCGGDTCPLRRVFIAFGVVSSNSKFSRALANLGLTAGPRAACYQPPSRLFKPDINLFNVISSLVLLQASVKQRGARRCKDQEERGADNHPGAVLPSPGEFWHPQSSSSTSKD